MLKLCSTFGLWMLVQGSEPEVPALERMRYDMRWKGLNVGEAVMEVHLTDDGLMRTFKVETTGVVSWFRTVEYQIESLSTDTYIRVNKRIRDGRFSQTDVLLISDGHATWEEQGGVGALKYEVPEEVTDYVSLLQTMRGAVALSPGQSRRMKLAMDGGLHTLTIEAIKTEKVEWKGQRLSVTLHELNTPSKVLFSRNTPRGFWLADDLNLILKMEIQTRIGLVHAHLADWKRNGVEVAPLILGDKMVK